MVGKTQKNAKKTINSVCTLCLPFQHQKIDLQNPGEIVVMSMIVTVSMDSIKAFLNEKNVFGILHGMEVC